MTQPDFRHSILERLDNTIDQFENAMKDLSSTNLTDTKMRKNNAVLLQIRKEIGNIRHEAVATLTRLNTFGATLETMAHPESGVDAILQDVMKWFLLLTECQRAFIALYDADSEAYHIRVDQDWLAVELRPMEHTISDDVIEEVQKTRDMFTSSNMEMASSSYQKSGSWRMPLRTVIGVPLIWEDEMIGIFYGDKKITSGAVARDMMPLFKLYAAQAAIAIHNTQLFAALSDKAQQ